MLKRIIMMMITLIAISLVASCGGGSSESDGSSGACGPITKILNGDLCGDSRSIVLLDLTFQSGRKSFCTGTFISQTSILTAAHCLVDLERLDKAFSVDIMINGAATSFLSWQVPENYIYSEFYGILPGVFDVGIIKVDERFMPAVGAAPQPLLGSRFPQAGETLIIAGYGLTEDGSISTDQPRAAEVTLTGRDNLNRLVVVPDESGKDTCTGDSGGPLLAKSVSGEYGITGITSFGSSINQGTKCGTGAVGYYTPIWNIGNSEFINALAPDAIIY